MVAPNFTVLSILIVVSFEQKEQTEVNIVICMWIMVGRSHEETSNKYD
jgi:hypothetical protein